MTHDDLTLAMLGVDRACELVERIVAHCSSAVAERLVGVVPTLREASRRIDAAASCSKEATDSRLAAEFRASVAELATTPCGRCSQPIGYSRPFYGPDAAPVHSDCEEAAYQQQLWAPAAIADRGSRQPR